MSQPLVSVMLPTYNTNKFVYEAIATVAEQDYDNLEVVVSDDGSTDGSVDIILECARKYPKRVIPMVNQPHLGITANASRNLKACRGKYIAFSAGDDLFLPGKIAKQVAWLEEKESHVLCGHDVDIFDSDTNKTLRIFCTPDSWKRGYGASVWVQHFMVMLPQSIMIRAKTIPTYGFDPLVPISSDIKLYIDCLATGGEFGYIDGVYARYRRHQHNITNQLDGYDHCLNILSQVEYRYPHLVNDCRISRSIVFVELGRRLLAERRYQEAKVYLWNALRTNPHIGRKLIYFLLVAHVPPNMRDLVRETRNRLHRYRTAGI